MQKIKSKENGFVLVIAMILLAVMSIVAITGMGLSTMGEKMAGNYMERNRAQLAAEQAITQAQTLLRDNAVTCLEAVCTSANLVGAGAEVTLNTLPSTWSDTNAFSIATAAGQTTTAKYLINALTHADFAKVDCRPYSIMGRGAGLNTNSTVVLQTIAYICPIS